MNAASPIAQLMVYTGLGFAFRRLLASSATTPTAAGSMVMAVGIFGVAALQEIPFGAAATQPLAIGLSVVWAFIATSYLGDFLNGRAGEHLASPVGSFAIGSWVAATATLVRLIVVGAPDWRPLAALLALLAGGTWFWFLAVAARSVRILAGDGCGARVPGVILLSTVSTQALALAAFDLLPDPQAFLWAARGLIAFGVFAYLLGLALMARSHFRSAGWTLADDWDNTNCILHGAMSITGLATVVWHAAPPAVSRCLWLYVAGAFVVVEGVELVRLSLRIAAYGWRRGAFAYRVTQWSRNFTFGMFYAFTSALAAQSAGGAQAPWIEAVQGAVLLWGPYVVLGLLLAEGALYLDDRLDRRAVASLARRWVPRRVGEARRTSRRR